MDVTTGSKRSHEVADEGGDPSKRQKITEDDFDALLDGALPDMHDIQPVDHGVAVEPPDEVARRAFAERVVVRRHIDDDELPALLETLCNEAARWSPLRRWRSVALLLTCVARSPRTCRAVFVAEGLPALGSLLQESVSTLEEGSAAARQEAQMWALACLGCLRALALGRATLWEHRHSVGKPFDRLHRWCSQERSALAADLRSQTSALCKRWRNQPRPAGQEALPEQKMMRSRVIDIVCQGLMGISGGNSPASPAPPPSPAGAMPCRTVAAEVETALFGRFGNASTHEYKQHARMLRKNLALPGNARLRERVLSGEIEVEELAAMDSASLAPDSLQEQRRKQHQKNLKSAIVKEMLPRLDTGIHDDQRNWNTAPPIMYSARSSSQDGGDLANAGSKDEQSTQESHKSPEPVLEPPPTPFRDFHAPNVSAPAGEHAPTPEPLATPAPEDDEEQEALIEYFIKSVH